MKTTITLNQIFRNFFRLQRSCFSAVFLLIFLLSASSSWGQTNTWDGSVSSNWNTAGNWSLNLVPTSSHDVVINTNAAISVNTNATINKLTVSDNATVSFTSSGGERRITIDNTGSSIQSGSSLTLRGSTGSGTRSMTIAFSGTSLTMSIAGSLILPSVGEGAVYNATNSITTVSGHIKMTSTGSASAPTITSTASNLIFASNGTYEHNINGRTIPTATWNANSTCSVTGVVTTVPTTVSFQQSFGNFTWNCASQTGDLSLAGRLRTVNGNFTITATNNGSLRLSNDYVEETLVVGGNFSQTGGSFYIAGDGSNDWIMNVAGNFSLSGGTLDMNGGDGTTNLNVSGNFTHSGGTLTETGAATTIITMNGTNSRTFQSLGQSNSVQITINKTGTATNDLVTLSANSRIDSNLTLTDGLLVLSTFNLTLGASTTITGGSTASMIVPVGTGEIRRTTTATGSFVYPIGDNTGTLEYTPVTVNVTAGSGFSSAYIGVSLEDGKHSNNNSATNFLTRSWKVNQSGITGCTATITGTYINAAADVTGTLGSIRTAQLNGTFNQATNPWVKTGGNVLSGTTLTYTGATITSGQVSVFTGITSADPTVSITGGGVTVCKDATVTLTANPVGDTTFTYLWSSGLGTAVTATPSTATVGGPTSYTVTVKDNNGISSAASTAVAVTVVAQPVSPGLTKNPNVATVCSGTILTVSITAGTGGTGTTADEYRFSTNNGSTWSAWSASVPSFAAVAGTNTIESRRTSTGSGCTTSSSNSVSWTVNAVPVGPVIAKSPNTAAVCVGTTLTMTVTTPGTGGAVSSQDEYRFSTNNGSSWSSWGTSLPSFAAVAGTNTIESRRTSTGSGCTTAAGNTLSWTVNALPVVIAGSQVCIGSTITLSPTAGGTWTSSNANTTVTNAGVVTGVTAGTATFTFTNTTTGCSATTSLVTVNALPVVNAGTAFTKTCLANTSGATIGETAVAGHTYSWSPSTGLSSATASNPTANPSTTTTYTVTKTNTASGCTATGTVIVTVDNQAPTVSVSANQSICAGSSATITASGATSYVWSNSLGTASSVTVSPSTTTTYNVTGTVANGCANTASTTVTVNPNLPASVSVGASSTTICSGASVTFTATPTNGGASPSYQWKVGSTNVGNNSATYTTTSLANNDVVSVVMTSTATCAIDSPATSNTVTMTVTPASVAPTSATASVTTMCGSGSATLTLTGGGGQDATIKWYTSSCGGTLVGTGNGLVVSPTSTTTYYGRYEGSCDVTSCASVTITFISATTTTWNGTTWSNGEPTASTAAIISGTFTSPGTDPNWNLRACKLTVNAGATVLIKSGDSVTLDGALIAATGSFVTFNSGANLIQYGTTNENTGAIVIKRESARIKRLDYTLWSSPVAAQGLQAFSPNTLSNRFYSYNSSTNFYQAVDPSATTFSPFNGYLVRTANTHPTTPSTWTGQFTGVPDNGNYSMAFTGYRVIGNPYPSAIDAENFIDTNIANGSITGTVYFWRKTNGSSNAAYCTYNLGGFVTNNDSAISLLPENANNGNNTKVVQVGQGFIVEGTGTSNVVFTNDMRIDSNVNRFLRTANTIERNRIWLNITNAAGSFSQAMIAYMTGATQGVDPSIDGKLLTDGDVSLASLIETTSYAIQGRALPFDMTDVVPMSFKVTTAGDYTITIDHVDGLFSNGAQTVYLRDNTTGVVHNLSTGAYTFTSASGTFDTRFEITYQATSLAVSTPIFNESQVVIYKTPTNEISINTGNVVMSKVKIFDIRGRLLQEKKDINASQTLMNAGLTTEVLLVQITSEEGIVVTKKVLFPRTSLKLDKKIEVKTQLAEDE